jgi:Concanavalin A-like lectin/glucanases superfamily/Domain of unknown function (DUF2341)
MTWIKKTTTWIKKKWKQTLVALGLTVAVALAWDFTTPPEMITTLDFNGQTINFTYTDDNTNEDFVIATDQQTYGGWDKTDLYMAVYNRSGKDKDVNLQVHFKGQENLVLFAEFLKDVPSTREVQDYGFKEYPCAKTWTTSTEPTMPDDIVLYTCGETKDKLCDRIDKDNNCEIDNDLIGSHTETTLIDDWKTLPTKTADDITSLIGTTGKQIPADFKAKKQSTYFIKDGETKFFKVRISYQPKQQGEFWITASSDKKIGLLDPWYSASYSYRKVLTIEAGYATGVATTTNAGFVVVASTTQEFLKKTGDGGGKIATNSGYDIIFVDDDDTTLLPFEIEQYASSTGTLVSFIRVPDISSTTDRTIYMYYGNASATNNATSGAVWTKIGSNASTTNAVWHLQQNPKATAPSMRDSTNYGNHGTATNFYSATSSVVAQLDGGLSFDGVNDYVSATQIDLRTGSTISAWVKANAYSGFIVYNRSTSVSTTGIMGLYLSSSTFKATVWNGAAYISAEYPANLNQWYHLAFVWNGTVTDLYVNGVPTNDKSVSISAFGTSNTIRIGVSSPGSLHFNGLIDDVRIYNYALTASDIKTQYNMSNRNDLFLTWGAEETPPAGGTTNPTPKQDIIMFE